MTTLGKVLVVSFVVLFILIIGSCSAIIGINNDFVKQEQIVKAQYEQNKNNYDNYFKKVKEVSQVPEMYTEDLKKVYDSVITKRYGSQGAKSLFIFIREHNPNFDSSLYKQIQQVVESGRNDFEMNQKLLVDKKRVYETMLNVFPKNIVASILGFPKVDLNSISIITSDETENVFSTKKSKEIKLR